MKRLLIAAGMAAMLMGAAPAVAKAAPAPQDMRHVSPDDRRMDDRRMDRRDDRRMDRRDDRRADRRWDRHHDRRWDRGHDRHWRDHGRHRGWGNNCRNVRKHHRWVRVCYRR